jgi:hypothetical protein
MVGEGVAVPGRELGTPEPCRQKRVIKGQSHKINDFLQDSMAGEGVAVSGRELGGALHSVLRLLSLYWHGHHVLHQSLPSHHRSVQWFETYPRSTVHKNDALMS